MWARDSNPSSGLMRVLSAVAFKSQVVVRSLMAFVLMSTVTALTVRTLLSSGVVIMFPMVMLLERMGLQGVDLQVALCRCCGRWPSGCCQIRSSVVVAVVVFSFRAG